jgi:hypothetical protein
MSLLFLLMKLVSFIVLAISWTISTPPPADAAPFGMGGGYIKPGGFATPPDAAD